MINGEILKLVNNESFKKVKFLTFNKSLDTLKFSREIAKISFKYEEINIEYETLRNNLIKKYGKTAEDGSIFIEPNSPHIQTFINEMNEFGNEEFDFIIKKFKADDIDDIVYSTQEDLKDKKLNVEDFTILDILFVVGD